MKAQIEYEVNDLSRALIREYLSQKGFKRTLEVFEKEDKNSKKKIPKDLLVEIISLQLQMKNKELSDSAFPLLEILVAYLNRKYELKKNSFTKTEPHFYMRKEGEQVKKNILKNETAQLQVQNLPRQRPSTAKPFRSSKNTKPGKGYRVEQLRAIYSKLNIAARQYHKSREKKQGTFKIEQKRDIQNQKRNERSNLEDNMKAKELERVKPKNEIALPSKVQDKFPAVQNKPLKNYNPPKFHEEYYDEFEEQIPTSQDTHSIKSVPLGVKEGFQSPLPNIEEEKFESSIGPSYAILEPQLPEKSLSNQSQSLNDEPLKQGRAIVNTMTINEDKQISNHNIGSPPLQEKLTPIPCLHGARPVQTQQVPQIIQQYKIASPNMGCIIENTEQIKALQVIREEEVEPAKNQEEPSDLKEASKPRTQMRLIGKNKSTNNQMVPSDENKEKKEDKQPVQSQEPLKNKNSLERNKALQQIKSQEEKPSLKEEKSPINLLQKAPQKIEQPQAPVMVTLGKKKRNKEEAAAASNEGSYPTKFQFDQNFTHGIPQQIKYQYQPYHIDLMVIDDKAKQNYPQLITDTGINYKVKGGGVPPVKKKMEKSIVSKDAQRLKTAVFQSGPSLLPKAWAQGFILSPFEETPYGLKQIEGGPCGIIAAVQCYYLKHLLYCSKDSNIKDLTVRQMCLVAAITNLLWTVKTTDKITLTFPPKGATKIDINNLRVNQIDAPDFPTAFSGVWANRQEFIGEKNYGVAALLYSAILTKGIDQIEAEIDIKSNPIIGNHGHCTQQFVNLVLTGTASSNCFDGEKIIDDYKIRGIKKRSQFGFLTVFQTLKYIEVGKHLKNPIFPIWVICKQFHYHVVFGHHYLIAENNKTEKFDIVYFDGLYNCGDRIRLTLHVMTQQQQENVKTKELPLIQQVLMTKWGLRRVDWNGSTKIL